MIYNKTNSEPSIPLILYYQGKTAKAAPYLFSDFEAIKQESVFLRKRKFNTAAEVSNEHPLWLAA